EGVPDLDQLVATDDDLLAGGEHEGAQQEGGGVVVDHVDAVDAPDLGKHPRERVERASPPTGPSTVGEVEFDVGAPTRGPHGLQRGGGQRDRKSTRLNS